MVVENGVVREAEAEAIAAGGEGSAQRCVFVAVAQARQALLELEGDVRGKSRCEQSASVVRDASFAVLRLAASTGSGAAVLPLAEGQVLLLWLTALHRLIRQILGSDVRMSSRMPPIAGFRGANLVRWRARLVEQEQHADEFDRQQHGIEQQHEGSRRKPQQYRLPVRVGLHE